MEFNIEERKQNPLFEFHSANVAECFSSFSGIILVVCVNQNFPNNKHFPFVIATTAENFVPLLEVQESREHELVSGVAPLSYPVGYLSITSMGLCPALLRCLTLWATSVSPVWVCVRRCSAVLPCHFSITSMGLCPALLRCPTLWVTSVSQVWVCVRLLLRCLTLWATSVSSVKVCVRRCSAVLPCGSPRYHKYGSVSGAAPLSYPVGHLGITNMGLCPACSAVLPCGPPQYHQYGSVSGVAPLSYPVGHLSITSMGLCPALLRCPTLPLQYHKYGSVSGVAPLSYPVGHLSITGMGLCPAPAPLSYPVGHLSIISKGLCPALLRCPTLWVTLVSQVWVCVRRCSAVLPCGSLWYHKYGSVSGAAPLSYPVGHLSITNMGLCPACSAVLPSGPPQYHQYGSVSGAAPLSYPVGHLGITSMGLCPALLRCPTLWVTSVSQVWVCVRRCSAVLPCGSPRYHKYGSVSGAAPLSYPVGHLSITNMGLCPALLRCPTLWVTSGSQVWVCVRRCSAVLPPQYHQYGSVYGVAPKTPSTGLRHPSFNHCRI